MGIEDELADLEETLEKCWGKDTCYPPSAEKWSMKNPAMGQCAVTALLVQDYYKGLIAYCSHHHHYWNVLPCGKEVDLTRKQFPPNSRNSRICLDGYADREYLLDSSAAEATHTRERYEILKERLGKKIVEEFLE